MTKQAITTIFAPAFLMALLCIITLCSGLNPILSLGLNRTLQVLPDILWANLTVLGDALICLAMINFGAKRYPLLLPAALIGGLLATLLTRSLKSILAVDRPLITLGEQLHIIGIDLHNFSFPSGHTTAIFLSAGLYALFYNRNHLTTLLFSAALLIGLSRVAVGAHWLADVLAGATVGWLCAWIGWKLAHTWQWAQTGRSNRILGLLFLLLALLLFLSDTGYPQARFLQWTIAATSSFAALLNLWHGWHTQQLIARKY